jgi:hypothetical protein
MPKTAMSANPIVSKMVDAILQRYLYYIHFTNPIMSRMFVQ